MLLKNAINLLKNMSLEGGRPYQVYSAMAYPIKDTSGKNLEKLTLYRQYMPMCGQMEFKTSYSIFSSSYAQMCGLIVGKGTTPATEDDYMMEDIITVGLSTATAPNVVTNISYDENEKSVNKRFTHTFSLKNTGSTAITVSEIGVFQNVSIDHSTYKSVLMYREVLENPVVLQVGEVKTFTLELNIKHTEV